MIRYITKVLVYWIVLSLFDILKLIHTDSAGAILLIAAVLALVNTLIRPIFAVIALPLNILTFGTASIFANLLTVIIANGITGKIISAGFWSMLLLSLFIMLADDLLATVRNRIKLSANSN